MGTACVDARLRSASTSTLVVPSSRRSTLGDRAFPVAAARAWNSMPPSVRSTSSLASFCLHLKTHVISSLTLNAILELSFCTVPLQQFLWQRYLNHIHSIIHSFIKVIGPRSRSQEQQLCVRFRRYIFIALTWSIHFWPCIQAVA